jgi:SPP1 gp7 family putative phage head morphogenesis protein
MAAPYQPPKVQPPKLRGPETDYGIALRKIAGHVGHVVETMEPFTPARAEALTGVLTQYAESLDEWSKYIAFQMVSTVNRRNEREWRSLSRTIQTGIQRELSAETFVGRTVQELIEDQAALIKSLPLEAARRVQKLALDNFAAGGRSKDIIDEIMRTGDITRGRATTIARTETGRASTMLTMARAQSVGATHYVWETSRDSRRRPSHKALQGKVIAFSDPPETDGLRYHAGAGPNCRCWMRVIIADE